MMTSFLNVIRDAWWPSWPIPIQVCPPTFSPVEVQIILARFSADMGLFWTFLIFIFEWKHLVPSIIKSFVVLRHCFDIDKYDIRSYDVIEYVVIFLISGCEATKTRCQSGEFKAWVTLSESSLSSVSWL